MKKLLSLLLTLCMILAPSITVFAEMEDYPEIEFFWPITVPVQKSDWYYSAACDMWEKYDRLFSFHFSADRNVTRIDLTAYMMAMDNDWWAFQPTFEPNPFTDLDAYHDNEDVIEMIDWAYNLDIIEGVSDTEFAPDGYLTREQLAVFLYRLSNQFMIYRNFSDQYDNVDIETKASIDTFPDADEVGEFATEAVMWAYGTGLMIGKGTPEGVYFAPKDTLTHAELLNVMYRYTKYFNVEMY